MKRLFDIVVSIIGLILFSPALLLLSIWVKLDSIGAVFYVQERVGRNGILFKLFKFRSMKPESDKKGLLTVGDKDNRITNSGYFLRKYKLDELPQLLNVLKGEMSFVGPRPEVAKFVSLYSEREKDILKVRPGITDLASLKYRDESEILKNQKDPEKYYTEVILKDKIRLNLVHMNDKDPFKDLKIIFRTILAITN